MEARNAFERAKPLKAAGHMAESAFDQREQARAHRRGAARSPPATASRSPKPRRRRSRRSAARSMWRRGRTEVMAPADGIVSRRMARVGGYAAGAAEPMFRIVAKGEVELDAEVIETRLAGVKEGQTARVEVAGRRHDRRQGAARLARGRQGDAARPRAHLPRRQPGAARRRASPAAPSRRPTAAASPCRPRPCSTGPTAPRCRSCATGRVETRRIKTGLAGRRAGRGARGLGRGRPRRVARPARSCATATPCGPSCAEQSKVERGAAMNWNISAWSIRQPVPALVLFMVLIALGYVSFGQLPSRAFPTSTCRSCRCASTSRARRPPSSRCRSPRRSRTPSPA